MTARSFVVALAIAAGCSGVSSNPDPDANADAPGAAVGTFDEELPGFRMTLCKEESMCGGVDELNCLRDVETDMADAKLLLDEAGEMRCARCMHVKTIELQKILDAACNASAASEAAVLAACDLDPNDGQDMLDEACGGYP